MNQVNFSRDGTASFQPTNDEISLYEVWQICRDGWRWPLVGLLGSLVGAAAFLAVTPPQYEAIALIKVGQLESQAQAIQRLNSASFQSGVLRNLGWFDEEKNRLYRTSIKVTPRNDLIEFKFRTNSPEDARTAGESTVAHLNSQQRESPLIRSAIEKAHTDAVNLSREIRRIESLEARVYRLGKKIPADNVSGQLVLIDLSEKLQTRLQNLRKEEVHSMNLLAPQATITATIEPLFVSDTPVFPRIHLVLLLAGVSGILLGLLAVIMRGRRQSSCIGAKTDENSKHSRLDRI